MSHMARTWAVLATLTLTASAASAAVEVTTTTDGKALPRATSTHDPVPPAPSPLVHSDAVLVKQAGIGSQVAYARGGVLELGGTVSFMGSREQTNLAVSPSLGWFVTDNFELSGIVLAEHSRSMSTRATTVTALVEPSVHVPMVDSAFVFGGLGVGGAYTADTGKGGFALAPRLGFNILVGRSGILSPSVGLNWTTSTVAANKQGGGGTMFAVNQLVRANIGYSVMW